MYRAVASRGGYPVAVAREARLELGERVTVDGEDVSAEAFETLGSLTALVADQQR